MFQPRRRAVESFIPLATFLLLLWAPMCRGAGDDSDVPEPKSGPSEALLIRGPYLQSASSSSVVVVGTARLMWSVLYAAKRGLASVGTSKEPP